MLVEAVRKIRLFIHHYTRKKRWIFKFSIRRSFQKQNLKRKNETQNGQVEEISRDAEKKSTSSKVRRYIKEGK